MKFCCEKFAENTGEECQGIEFVAGVWSVNGCCGGGCFVLHDLKFCPFCGERLKVPVNEIENHAG